MYWMYYMYFRKKMGRRPTTHPYATSWSSGKNNMITTITRKEHSGECEWLIIPCMREAICIKLGNGSLPLEVWNLFLGAVHRRCQTG